MEGGGLVQILRGRDSRSWAQYASGPGELQAHWDISGLWGDFPDRFEMSPRSVSVGLMCAVAQL